MRHRIFSPFDRLGAEQSGIEGTGLGLALAKRLTEAMGGEISLTDAEGGGAIFTVELRSAEDPEHTKPHKAPTQTPVQAEAPTVLYIEDNFSNTKLMEAVVAHVGMKLLTCSQGRLGYEEAKASSPDVILLDLDLPDVPGMEVLRMLKVDPVTQSIPVIIVSADANPGREQRAVEHGAEGYITKPFELGKMIEVLRSTFKVESAA